MRVSSLLMPALLLASLAFASEGFVVPSSPSSASCSSSSSLSRGGDGGGAFAFPDRRCAAATPRSPVFPSGRRGPSSNGRSLIRVSAAAARRRTATAPPKSGEAVPPSPTAPTTPGSPSSPAAATLTEGERGGPHGAGAGGDVDGTGDDNGDRMTSEDERILFGDDGGIGGSNGVAFPAQHRSRDRHGNVLSDPLINKLHTMRDTVVSCPDLWIEMARHCPDKRALYDEHLCDGDVVDLSFGQMSDAVRKSASAFSSLGVVRGRNVAVLGENSASWLLVDQGIQLCGGVSAVRGADAPLDELRYIYEHSDSAGIAVLQGPRLLQKLGRDALDRRMSCPLGFSNDKYGDVRTVVLMHREKFADEQIRQMSRDYGVDVVVFADLMESSRPMSDEQRPRLTRDDLSTIVYTSGTTGHPKGVMLSHGNLLHQVGHRLAPSMPYDSGSEPVPGEKMLSLLPVWHITERTFELWMASRGCSVVYSSIRTFKNDLAKHKPEWMVLVPRVLEKIANGVQDKFSGGGAVVKALSKFFASVGAAYNKYRKISRGRVVADEQPGPLEKLGSSLLCAALSPLHAAGNKLVWSKVRDGFGGNVKVIISGGSALAGSLETFYETAGMNICVGYGLTECSPLISYRRSDDNLVTAGCTGKACLDTELRVVDPEIKTEDVTSPRPSLPDGEVGVVVARGPQVMRGYYKNADATSKAVDKFGWFDTGDLGRFNPATGDLILTGRAKDTIVLSNGENVEPQPIEDAILTGSSLIDQVMLTGQDGRSLTAIVVLNPSEVAERGYLSTAEGKRLQAAHDRVNDPKCDDEDRDDNCRTLNAAAVSLRRDKELTSALIDDVKRATGSGFQKWEQVRDVYLTMEPFAMSNGQLTQSYKVKRDAVQKRYADEL